MSGPSLTRRLPPPPVHPSLRRSESTNPPVERPAASTTSVVSDTGTIVETRPVSPAQSPSPSNTDDMLSTSEEELTEAELRQTYDEEEIERFLNVFTDHIREVRTPQAHSPGVGSHQLRAEAVLPNPEETSNVVDEGLVDPQQGLKSPAAPGVENPLSTKGLAEWAACQVIALLPPAPPASPPFTAERLRLTIRRAFMVFESVYSPCIVRALDLATWKDPRTSFKYCAAYWVLWYHDLLLAGLMSRLLYALIRRKYMSYPTLKELRQRRSEQDGADAFSKWLILRLTLSPTTHAKDIWYSLRRKLYPAKNTAGDSTVPVDTGETTDSLPDIVIDNVATEMDPTAVQTEEIVPILSDNRLAGPALEAVNQIIDLHERVQNLFLWRRPQLSHLFALVLVAILLFSLLPVKYIVKLASLGAGMFFWHIIPIIVAIPPHERRRLPPPLTQVPTDAEYAMDLISQRVALGLPLQPTRRKRGKATPSPSRSSTDLGVMGVERTLQDTVTGSVDWDKWSDRLVDAKTWTGDVKGMFKDGSWKNVDNWPTTSRRVPTSGEKEMTFTYPAQCGKVPGLITLADSKLFFTAITSFTPSFTINLQSLTVVKRSGLAKGLQVRWTDVDQDGKTEEREQRFLWVSGRDDLFARLIGSQSGRWLKV